MQRRGICGKAWGLMGMWVVSSFSLPALAAPGTASSSTSTIKKPVIEAPVAENKAHLLLDLSHESNMYSTEEEKQISTALTIFPSYQLTETTTLSAKTIIEKEQTGAQDTTVSNTTLRALFKGPQISENTTSDYRVSAVAPTNEAGREEQSFQGALALSGHIGNQYGILKTDYTLGLNRNFHEFTTSAEGTPNIQYTLTHVLGLELAMTDKLSLAFEGSYKTGWTYKNFQRQSFTSSVSLGYQFNPTIAGSIGVSNEGSATKADGTTSNIKVFDENTSKVSAGITITI
jgi:hypothetical protein